MVEIRSDDRKANKRNYNSHLKQLSNKCGAKLPLSNHGINLGPSPTIYHTFGFLGFGRPPF